MYHLKLFDETLLTFEMSNELGLEISDINVVSDNKKVFPALLFKDINEQSLESFLRTRVIPKNRWFVGEILKSIGVSHNDIKGIIDVCKGLSLNDSFWIVEDDNLKFSDFNLYDNEFSETLSLIAFTGYTSKIRGIITSPELTTNGMLPKAWRRIDNKVYLYKGSTAHWNFSNTGFEPYSEYYASEIANVIGINAVEYDLVKWKGMLVSSCEIFTSKEYSYVPIGYIVTTGGINAVYKFICQQGFEKEFADMIMFDALIYNPDRHYGNFGFLKNNYTGELEAFAPIFDNGEGLHSKAGIDAFNDISSFAEYLKDPETNTSYAGADYKNLVRSFCGKSQVEKLRKLLSFEFKPHPMYNLPEQRLSLLSKSINARSRELISLITDGYGKSASDELENDICCTDNESYYRGR